MHTFPHKFVWEAMAKAMAFINYRSFNTRRLYIIIVIRVCIVHIMPPASHFVSFISFIHWRPGHSYVIKFDSKCCDLRHCCCCCFCGCRWWSHDQITFIHIWLCVVLWLKFIFEILKKKIKNGNKQWDNNKKKSAGEKQINANSNCAAAFQLVMIKRSSKWFGLVLTVCVELDACGQVKILW